MKHGQAMLVSSAFETLPEILEKNVWSFVVLVFPA